MTNVDSSRPPVRMRTAEGRWLLVATILGSGVASLDGTAVGVTLPALGRSLDASVIELQLVVIGYLTTLARVNFSHG